MDLPARMVALHHALARADLPHAFGGALALAWCTGRARGTIDIDLNVFIDGTQDTAEPFDTLLAALPSEIVCDAQALSQLRRDGQARLYWDATPVDVFLNTTELHRAASGRVRWELFSGVELPFLDCYDIAVFKAFFNRTKDWADLEEMLAAGTLDVARIAGELLLYLGPDDERLRRLRALRSPGTS